MKRLAANGKICNGAVSLKPLGGCNRARAEHIALKDGITSLSKTVLRPVNNGDLTAKIKYQEMGHAVDQVCNEVA